MYRKLLSAASAAFLLSIFCVDGASAAGGCGPGFHRGPYGACRPNGPVVVAPVAPVVSCCGTGSCSTGTSGLRRWLPLAPASKALRGPLTAYSPLPGPLREKLNLGRLIDSVLAALVGQG